MTWRALDLLDLKESSYVLDIGCGSGLSGEILSGGSRQAGARNGNEDEDGNDDEDGDEDDEDVDLDEDQDEDDSHSNAISHEWVGLDISASMLSIARFDRDVQGDLVLADMGQGLGFRPGSFDGAISISALQWLCTAESNDDAAQPDRRLKRFFGSLFVCLRRGARAVLQFYPRDATQTRMISTAAAAAGFGVGLLEDDGGTKNAKLYLVCTVGGNVSAVVAGMDGVSVEERRRLGRQGKAAKGAKGSRDWITRKKDVAERRGKVVKADSKYTGRKRKPRF